MAAGLFGGCGLTSRRQNTNSSAAQASASLWEAALASGYIGAHDFDRIVNPSGMVGQQGRVGHTAAKKEVSARRS